jgi:type VI secretion system protein ImpG
VSDDLLPYYNRELAQLWSLSAEFGEAHPKIARRLRIGTETVEDPHVSRLIETVAFLNARIRRKLDDDFPELTDAMLGVLYPHFLAPIPSMAIVKLECDPDLTTGYVVPRGTMIETEPIDGEPCRFRTAYPTTAWPVAVKTARLDGTPFRAPTTPRSSKAVAALRISLETRAEQVTFAELAPRSLRFFLKGRPQDVHALHELLLNDALEVALADGPDDRAPVVMGPDSIQPVGFGLDEGLLPYTGRSFPGYRLLTEFFAFPAKFLFVDIVGLDADKVARLGRKLELFVYTRRSHPDLQQSVDAETFQLGCTPIINLFQKRAEPVRLTNTETEHRVVPDARRPMAMEIYSVNRVTATSPRGETLRYLPFYGVEHGHTGEEPAFFYPTRRPAPESDGQSDPGTEVALSLVDLDFRSLANDDWVLEVETTCLNRNLPNRIPFGGDDPRLSFSEGGGPIQRIRCLTAPTPTTRPALGDGARWKLISHLSLNHFSISGGREGRQALREILRLYDAKGSPENRNVIEGVLDVETRPIVRRVTSGGHPGFCRGTEVKLRLDESRFSGGGLFLFASVLECFLGLYCSANSFVEVAVTTNAREGELRRWAPRAGDRPLL